MKNRRTEDSKLARIDENIINMNRTVEKISERVDTLWDSHNQNKGILSFGRMLAGVIGGGIVVIANYVSAWASK